MMTDHLNRETEGFHGLLTPSPKLGYREKCPAAELSELLFRNGGGERFLATIDDQTVFARDGILGDPSVHHSAFPGQEMRKQRSIGPAMASEHDIQPDALQVTANGESSQTSNNDALLSPDTVVRSRQTYILHDQVHTQVSDHDSSPSSTEATCPHIVLNMTPPPAESRRTTSSLEIREIGPVLHLPSPESRRGSFISTGREEQTILNRPKLTETSLGITAQAVLALLTIRSGGSSLNLTDSAKILLHYAVACNIVGFLCCIIGSLVAGRRPGVAARITIGIGYIATIYGFVAVVSMQLDDSLKLWITVAAWIALFPILLAFAIHWN